MPDPSRDVLESLFVLFFFLFTYNGTPLLLFDVLSAMFVPLQTVLSRRELLSFTDHVCVLDGAV